MNSVPLEGGVDFNISQESLKATILCSLLSAWVLTGLFAYLNRYTKRRYFTIWTTAWLFYIVWLTLNMHLLKELGSPVLVMAKEWCLASVAVFLLWGGVRFLGMRVRQVALGLFLLFLMTWSFVGVFFSEHGIRSQVPLYGLIGLASVLTSSGFFLYRRRHNYMGATLLSLGFFLWGGYMSSYPFFEQYDVLSVGFFISAVLQLFIAVSMIILVLEEVRFTNRAAFEQMRSFRFETTELRAKVASTQERYQNLFDQTSEAIVITSAGDLRILAMNETAERMLGINRLEAAEQFLPTFCQSPGARPASQDSREWVSAVCQQRHLNLIRRNGVTTPSEVDGSPIDYEGQAAFQFFFREITDRTRLEQQLRQAEKLSALGQMISGVSHELNNPLSVIKGYLDLIIAHHELQPQTRSDLTKVVSECNRAVKLVRNFLAFAREQPSHREMIQINELIERVAELRAFDATAAKVTLELDLDDDLPPTQADPDQLQQVITNIVVNSIQALGSHPGPRLVRISTSRKSAETLFIKVEDNGPGVPAEHQHRIFEPFFTTKEVGKGTGLGLSIAHSILTDHRGRIYYEVSALGGAGFILELPITKPGPARLAKVSDGIRPRFVRPAQVLVLDDEKTVAEMVCEMLSVLGHNPMLCLDAASALELINKREFDLVISDYRMPVINGEEFYRRVLERKPEMANRIIFLTGDVATEETLQFVQSTGNPHLGKPFHLANLEDVVVNALAETATKPGPDLVTGK